MAHITREQWEFYEREGYLKLGKLLSDEELAALQQRINEIMLGTAKLNYEKILMQLDSETGKYEDAGEQSFGHKGATLSYRKIQELEQDDLFWEYTSRPIFKEICDHVYGHDTSVSTFRAMFMNKPAKKGTFLPWHQDRWVDLSIDPLITLWTALDPATKENGCVQILPRSHKHGLYNPSHHSAFLRPDQADEIVDPAKIVFLELPAGESVLLHNWLVHSSDVNQTEIPRRAFSVCYMLASTRSQKGLTFPVVFK